MKSLTDRLQEVDTKIGHEENRHYTEKEKLRKEREQVISDFYKEREALKKKNFSNLVKDLRIRLLQNQYIRSVIKSRKPFEIVVEKSGYLKHSELYSIVKEHSKLSWISESSGIPNVFIFTLSEKEQTKLEPK